MTNVLSLLAGLMTGGCLAAAVLSCIQLNRIRDYEQEIRMLREKLKGML